MTGTKPRDLTPEDLALTEAPAVGGAQSVPLRIPPGSTVAIELLNPAAADAASPASFSADPDEAGGQAAGAPYPGLPLTGKPSAR